MNRENEVGTQYHGRYFRWTTDADGNYVGRPRDEWLAARYPRRIARVLSRLRVTAGPSPYKRGRWWSEAAGRNYYTSDTREGAAWAAFTAMARSRYKAREIPYAYSNGTLRWPDETWQERAARDAAEREAVAA